MWSSRASPVAAAVALLAVSGAAVGATPAQAKAPPTRKLCVDRIAVRDAPEGYAIGYLHRPQRLTVRSRPVDRWVLVRGRDDLQGWIPEKALCKRRAP